MGVVSTIPTAMKAYPREIFDDYLVSGDPEYMLKATSFTSKFNRLTSIGIESERMRIVKHGK